MKYSNMILREDGSFDFYSNLKDLHKEEDTGYSYAYFQRQLKQVEYLTLKNGSKVFRKEIKRV